MSVAVMSASWINHDQLMKNMTKVKTRQDSQTMELDKSQPPTPDGTGNPTNFHQIAPGLYRSSYPSYPHFEALKQLHLKTIITLVPQEIGLDYSMFISTEGIIHHHIPILANKDPNVFSDVETVHKVLEILLEPANFPLMIHCNKGRHRTGCMVACFRKVTGWTDEACINEYVRYASPKERELDKKFIERFDPISLKATAYDRGFIGGVYRQPQGISEESIRSIYTNNTIETYTSNEDEHPNFQYQEAARRANNDLMESSRRWSLY